MRHLFAICFFVLFLPATAFAQIITVKAELSQDTILIGDQIVFTLKAEMDKTVHAEFPELVDTLTRDIEVLIPVSADTTITGSRKLMSHSWLITSFEEGVHIIPVQKIVYSTERYADTALTMPVLLYVIAPEVDTTRAIMPIKPPMNTPVTLKEIIPWILISYAGLLGLTLVIALVWLFTQRKKDPEVFVALRQEPPHIIAFRELDRLKEEKLWEKGRVKEFYTRLTEIIRTYIERQYGIHAMESTTDEILTTFNGMNIEDEVLNEMLRELLNLADLVKFAKEDPLPVENQTNLNNGYLFIQKTYPFFYREELKLKEEETDA
ncbi:MAG TPA: hypothetical protein ENN61_03055 [Bacteroidaceae bacterium]|nr:hypothetical protein [Bacteroidaceae bacterium]